MRLLIVCVVFTSPLHGTFSRHLHEAFSMLKLLIIHEIEFFFVWFMTKISWKDNWQMEEKKIRVDFFGKIVQIFLIGC